MCNRCDETNIAKIMIIHPGEIIIDEFLIPLNIRRRDLAFSLGVDEKAIGDVLNGEAPISVELAIRLGKYFGMSTEFWLNLQMHYDEKAYNFNIKPHAKNSEGVLVC